MHSLVLAAFASETVMGQQVYERAVIERAESALARTGGEWRVQRLLFRSLRSTLEGQRRLPAGMLATSSAATRRMLARVSYPRAHVVHRMSFVLPPAVGRDVVTVHDVVPWLFDDEIAPNPVVVDELKKSLAIVTPSQFSADEIQSMFGVRRPVVIPNGLDRDRFQDAQPLGAELLAAWGVEGSYVLTAGGASTRKNLAALAEAWPIIRSKFPRLRLILTGPPHPRRTALFAALDGVVLLGRIDDELMPGLLAGARALVVPSTYEGFGLPALEAMAVGVPVVAANSSSLPEVVGPCGTLVSPNGPAIAEGVIHAVSRGPEIERMVEAGLKRSESYSWEKSAQAHAALWRSIVEQ